MSRRDPRPPESDIVEVRNVHDSGRTNRQIEERVCAVIAAMAPGSGAAVAEDTDLRAGLEYSSLRLIELTMALEQYLGLPPIDMAEAGTVTTVGDVIQLAVQTANQAEASERTTTHD